MIVIASCMGATKKVKVDDSFTWLVQEAETNEDFDIDVVTEGTRAYEESLKLHEIVEEKSKLEWVDCILSESGLLLYEE